MLLHALFTFFALGASISVIPGAGYLPNDVRAGCRVALSENITACSDMLQYPEEFIPTSALQEICTTSCSSGLMAMYAKASSACGTGSVNITTNVTSTLLVPLDLAGELVYRYNITCLQDMYSCSNESLRNGGFCKEKLENLTADLLCSDCYMKKVQLEIGEPLGTTDRYSPKEFNELKQSCGIPTASYPVKPTTPATGTPSPTPTCTQKYIAKSGETIKQISKSLSVSTDRLLLWNNLPLSLNESFTGGETLCLDSVSKCLVKEVVASDTCTSLVGLSGKGVDDIMFRSWNPSIGHDCLNLPAMVGKYICISPPGQTTAFTPVEGSIKPTITTSSTPEATYSWGTVPNSATSSRNFTTSWMYPTEPVEIATKTATPLPLASQSAVQARISHCPFNNEEEDSWDEGLEPDEFHLHSWDMSAECMDDWTPYCYPDPNAPILPSPTNISSSCYPTISTYIPDGGVAAPAPTQKGSPDNCNKWHVVRTGDTCDSLALKYKTTNAKIHEWNPVLNAQCSNLLTEFAYCVRVWVEPSTTPSITPTPTSSRPSSSTVPSTTSAGPPGPTETGTSPTCTKWHLDKQGDTCDSIAAQYGIIVSRFRQLNRAVNSACTNLKVGNAYCVG